MQVSVTYKYVRRFFEGEKETFFLQKHKLNSVVGKCHQKETIGMTLQT